MHTHTYVHMQHNKMDDKGNIRTLYSENTAQDVLVDTSKNKVIPMDIETLQDLINQLTKDALDTQRIDDIKKFIGSTDISAFGDGSITSALEYIDSTKGTVTTDPTTVGSSIIDDKPLLASGWNGNEYTIKSPLVNKSSMITIMASTNITPEEYDVYDKAQIIVSRVGTRIFTVTAMGEVPKIDLPVRFFVGDAIHLNDLPKIVYLDVTLNNADWNTDNEIIIEDESIRDDRMITLTVADNMTVDQYNSMAAACIEGLNVVGNRLTLKAYGDKPIIDLPIKIVIGDIISTSDLNADYEKLTAEVAKLQETIDGYIDNTAGLVFSVNPDDNTLNITYDDGRPE